jgi:hypothetical protein
MRERALAGWLICLCAGSAGCGDTPHMVVRDAYSAINEVADAFDKIPAGESIDTTERIAEHINEAVLKPMKGRWESIKKRADGFTKYDKEQKEALIDAEQYFSTEGPATEKRMANSIIRLARIRDALMEKRRSELRQQGKREDASADTELPKIAQCLTFPKSMTGVKESAKQVIDEFRKTKK